MSSDIHSVLVGEVWRKAGMVAKASGSAITTGTANYYLKCLTGANAGKWWKDADQTWDASETANAMTHQADGGWTITLTSTPFVDAIVYYEYAKESGDLHVAGEGRLLRGKAVLDDVNASKLGGQTVTAAAGITVAAYVGTAAQDTAQTGDAYAVVNHADHGNAKLVRSTTPANTLTVDSGHAVTLPTPPSGYGGSIPGVVLATGTAQGSGTGNNQIQGLLRVDLRRDWRRPMPCDYRVQRHDENLHGGQQLDHEPKQ
jgi:hypothetical protein